MVTDGYYSKTSQRALRDQSQIPSNFPSASVGKGGNERQRRREGRPRPVRKRENPAVDGNTRNYRIHEMGDEGLKLSAQTPGVTDNSSSGDAHVVQSSELGAPWQQIRTLISDCSDLPLEARQSMVTQGDEAAAIASKASRRDSQQDQQA